MLSISILIAVQAIFYYLLKRKIMTTKDDFIAQLQAVTTQLTTANTNILALLATATGSIPDDVVAALTPLQAAATTIANIAPTPGN